MKIHTLILVTLSTLFISFACTQDPPLDMTTEGTSAGTMPTETTEATDTENEDTEAVLPDECTIFDDEVNAFQSVSLIDWQGPEVQELEEEYHEVLIEASCMIQTININEALVITDLACPQGTMRITVDQPHDGQAPAWSADETVSVKYYNLIENATVYTKSGIYIAMYREDGTPYIVAMSDTDTTYGTLLSPGNVEIITGECGGYDAHSETPRALLFTTPSGKVTVYHKQRGAVAWNDSYDLHIDVEHAHDGSCCHVVSTVQYSVRAVSSQ